MVRLSEDAVRENPDRSSNSVRAEWSLAGGNDGEEDATTFFMKSRTNVKDYYYNKPLFGRELARINTN